MRRFANLADLETAIGTALPPGPWRRPAAQDAERFAELTGDRQWFHTPTLCGTSPGQSGQEEPPIYQAAFLLGLTVGMLAEVYAFPWARRTLQRGYDDVRFPASAPIGSAMRIIATPRAVTTAGRHGYFLETAVVMECDAAEKPVLRGRFIALLETGAPDEKPAGAEELSASSIHPDEE